MENQNQVETPLAANTGCVYDAQLKLLLRNKVYVADICNAVVYGGRQVVTAHMLEPRPVEQNAVLARGDGGFTTDNRFRDLAFFVRRGENDEGFLLCLEVQCSQSLEMPRACWSTMPAKLPTSAASQATRKATGCRWW